jgi:hypothetical protein
MTLLPRAGGKSSREPRRVMLQCPPDRRHIQSEQEDERAKPPVRAWRPPQRILVEVADTSHAKKKPPEGGPLTSLRCVRFSLGRVQRGRYCE